MNLYWCESFEIHALVFDNTYLLWTFWRPLVLSSGLFSAEWLRQAALRERVTSVLGKETSRQFLLWMRIKLSSCGHVARPRWQGTGTKRPEETRTPKSHFFAGKAQISWMEMYKSKRLSQFLLHFPSAPWSTTFSDDTIWFCSSDTLLDPFPLWHLQKKPWGLHN